MRLFRSVITAALVGGLVMALVEMAMAMSRAEHWPLSGLVTILAADLTAALVLGLLAGGVLALLTDADALAHRFRQAAGLFRPRAPEVEAVRVARTLGFAAGGALGVVLLFRVDRHAVDVIGARRGDWILLSARAAAGVAFAALVGALLRALLEPLLARAARRAPRLVSMPSLIALGALTAVAMAFAAGPTLEQLAAAFDLRPFVLAGVLAIAATGALAAAVCHPRGAVVAARATRLPSLLATLAVIAGAWLIALGPASDDRAAVRLARREAPVTGRVLSVLARLLDRDGDGYSAYFGDGDCAPTNSRIRPNIPDIAGDGIDQDCFDGDLDPATLPTPPPSDPRPSTLPPKLSFVVVFIDTLRPDHLGAYGHDKPTSPNIDRIARDGVVFERAYAASTYTTSSLAGFATARPPGHSGYRVIHRDTGDIPTDLPVFLEAFRAAGYRTGVVTDLASRAPVAFRGAEINRGIHQKPLLVVPTALEVLDKFGDEPFVLVVYFAGPHAPYRHPPGAPDFGDAMPDLYDSAVAFTDTQLGALFDRLDQPRYRDKVALTVLSDHGEAFGEHGAHYHGHNVYDETVRIPMIFRVPGLAARRLGAAPVSLTDVVPTLLHLAGLPPLPGALGHDLTGELATGTEDLDRRVFVEAAFPSEGYQAAVVSQHHKLVLEEASRTLLLYDLDADPGERRDLASALPDVFVDLRRTLAAYRSQARP